jgi:carboxypeptidase Q
MEESLDISQIKQIASDHLEEIYSNLETLCICYPARLSGSDTLEHALDYLFQYGQQCLPCESCKAEVVENVPRWIRSSSSKGEGQGPLEECVISIEVKEGQWPKPFPLKRQIRLMANGLSVGTSEEGINGYLVIVKDFEELVEKGTRGEIQNKIVLFDYQNYTGYGDIAKYRFAGAREASKYGAVAALIRTLTPNSSCSGAHTGTQASNVTIPSACVAIEDVELLARLIKKGYKIHIDRLFLPCFQMTSRSSRNLIFEIRGVEKPEEIVIVGGHTDSWDCQHTSCQGAHDDGQGVIISLEIIRLLHKYGLKPKRTIRAVLFVDEEVGQSGANAYQQTHVHEAPNVIAAIETDLGVGRVCGFGFTGTSEARETLKELFQPLSQLGIPMDIKESWTGKGVDISPMIEIDHVPGLLLRHDDTWWNEEYFHIHHSASDTIDHVDKTLLSQNFAVLLGAVWLLANTDVKLPRNV